MWEVNRNLGAWTNHREESERVIGERQDQATGWEVEPADKGMWYVRDVQSSVFSSSCLGSDINLHHPSDPEEKVGY